LCHPIEIVIALNYLIEQGSGEDVLGSVWVYFNSFAFILAFTGIAVIIVFFKESWSISFENCFS
jgi:hypothetical protein